MRPDGSVGSYYCHAEKQGGDSIGLVARFGGGDPRPETRVKINRQPLQRRDGGFDAEAYAARLDASHEALGPLSVSAETFRRFRSGYAATGVHRGKLALALHDREGMLIGHFGRSLKDESPLLAFLSGQNPAEHIFGAHLVGNGDLCIARDPLDVIVAHENGETNVVAFLTEGIGPQQWEMLASLMDQKKVGRSFLF